MQNVSLAFGFLTQNLTLTATVTSPSILKGTVDINSSNFEKWKIQDLFWDCQPEISV